MIQQGLYYGPPDKDHYCAYLYIVGGQERRDLRCPNDIGFYVKIPDGRDDDWRKGWAACREHLPIVIWHMQEAYSGRTFYYRDYVLRAFVPEGEEDGIPARDGGKEPEAEVPGASPGEEERVQLQRQQRQAAARDTPEGHAAAVPREDHVPVTWTHAICGLCWEARCMLEGQPGRTPTVLVDPPRERCCFCGMDTQEGIYVRNDPRVLTCSHPEEE